MSCFDLAVLTTFSSAITLKDFMLCKNDRYIHTQSETNCEEVINTTGQISTMPLTTKSMEENKLKKKVNLYKLSSLIRKHQEGSRHNKLSKWNCPR